MSYYAWTGSGWARSYAPGVALARGLGDVSELRDTLPVFYPSSVYVLRFKTTGADVTSARDALAFVRAMGQETNLGVDIRGVGIWQDDGQGEGELTVDLVWTVPHWSMRTPLYGDSSSSLALKIQNDPSLRATFPNLVVSGAIFAELTAPAQAVTFWQAQPVLWTSAHEGDFGTGSGGPTNSFANPPGSSVVKGKADDGMMATPWPVDTPPIVGPPGAAKPFFSGSVSTAGIAVFAALGLGLGYYVWTRHGAKRHA